MKVKFYRVDMVTRRYKITSRAVREEYINTARSEKERTERSDGSRNKLSEMYSSSKGSDTFAPF
jgi:hypothetical protein